jgi:hypothetical protein
MLGGIPDRACSGVGVLETIGGKARRHRDTVCRAGMTGEEDEESQWGGGR